MDASIARVTSRIIQRGRLVPEYILVIIMSRRVLMIVREDENGANPSALLIFLYDDPIESNEPYTKSAQRRS